jgi:EAL domain-containing protein (putative c-di-GMP-specific phosphodiesterase class I)
MELAGFEALVRWRHKSLGLLAPESFIGLAETTGMIKDIGNHVLNEAGRQLGIWQRAFRPHDPLFVAVNVSSSQFLATGLMDEVKTLLTRENLVRDTLKLEITESIVMENPELVIQILDRLKQMGIGLACDDFGTGYSSLSNLRRLPFDTLKVDRSFIEVDSGDAKASLILESIILLAHDLGLAIVAEGIQSQDDVDRMGALACDFGQGYFIGEPMTAKQVVDVLSGVPFGAAKHKTAIDTLWERMAGTSNVRVPEPQPAPVEPMKTEPAPIKGGKPMKPEPAPVKSVKSEAAPVKQPQPAVKATAPAEEKLVKPGRPSIVLLPPLTPPVFDKHGTASKRAGKPPASVVSKPGEVVAAPSDLVKSEPARQKSPPLPGVAPMAPRAAPRPKAEELEEAPAIADESPEAVSGELSEPESEEASAKKAKASRLGKRLRRKTQSKEHPPAEV